VKDIGDSLLPTNVNYYSTAFYIRHCCTFMRMFIWKLTSNLQPNDHLIRRCTEQHVTQSSFNTISNVSYTSKRMRIDSLASTEAAKGF